MGTQIIMRDGEPEYAVIPWADYQALLEQAGRTPVIESPDERRLVRPGLAALRGLREEQGHSVQALARVVGISPSYLDMIERGEREPDDAIKRALAHALGLDGWEARA
ncbi:helix-turn-helix transcriptional regulator [Stutzerimonas urumqiensis]|uniref:helix-turn-helix domain-containing protein n=1 Tax=Stutzerimonas urumqiensis TaxID=638269 RepID=UPI003BA9893B